jgi:hypothetical protein
MKGPGLSKPTVVGSGKGRTEGAGSSRQTNGTPGLVDMIHNEENRPKDLGRFLKSPMGIPVSLGCQPNRLISMAVLATYRP